MSTNLSGAYNTPQHLYYIGDNVNKKIRNTYQDSLIFDRERRSVYAQNHEFGYICNYENSIKVRNADGTNSVELTLTVENGEIRFKEYRSVLFTMYTPKYTVPNNVVRNNNTFVLGSTVTLSQLDIMISGSEESDIFNLNNIYETPNKNILEITDLGLTENVQRRFTFNTTTYGSDIQFTSTNSGNHNILKLDIIDPRNSLDSKTLSITWQNHVMIYKWSKNDMDFYGLQTEINNNNYTSLQSLTDTFGSLTLYNNLSGTHKISVSCDNGPNEYLALCCPTRICNSNTITGVLGGAAVQEFKKIKSVSYTNSASYTENYNIYLATGHNWKGSSLVIQ